HLRVQIEPLRHDAHDARNLVQRLARHAGLDDLRSVGFGLRFGQFLYWRIRDLFLARDYLPGAEHRVLVAPPEHLDHLVDLFLRDDALAGELARVNLAHAGVLADALVHQWLRVARFVGFVVAVTAE